MKKNEIRQEAEQVILHTYNRYPVVLDKGEGVYLYDIEGKKYLDFAAGIAVQALGYHYAGYDEALKEQIDKLTHISNLYYSVPMEEAAAKLIKASGMSKVFFTNSGTEAIEGALKAARRYSYNKYGRDAMRSLPWSTPFTGGVWGLCPSPARRNTRFPSGPLWEACALPRTMIWKA